ncbi:MAG: nucleoside deaminase [Desulfobacula sp.]|nr:nucleoside deaminase [Desulfobacula sp.]
MSMALDQARIALDRGDFPVGCVIVQDSRVIAFGERQGTRGDRQFFSEIDHAEIRALKNLENCSIRFEPEKAILYVTMEPCLMCFAAIILSGIKKIIYAFEDPMGGGTKCDLTVLPPLYKHCDINVVSGVLRKDSHKLLYSFFNRENNKYWNNSYLENYILNF